MLTLVCVCVCVWGGVYPHFVIPFNAIIVLINFQCKNVNVAVLQPLLSTRWAKWAERPPKVMRGSERRNTLLIEPSWGFDLKLQVRPLSHT